MISIWWYEWYCSDVDLFQGIVYFIRNKVIIACQRVMMDYELTCITVLATPSYIALALVSKRFVGINALTSKARITLTWLSYHCSNKNHTNKLNHVLVKINHGYLLVLIRNNSITLIRLY